MNLEKYRRAGLVVLVGSGGWVILVAVILLSWGGFGESGQEYSGIIGLLFATGGLSLLPFGLWYSVRIMPEKRWLIVVDTVLFGLIAVWLLILASSYRRPDEWTCLDRDYSVPLIGFWLMALFQFGGVLPKIISEGRTAPQQSEIELLLTQASVLSVYTTPWVAGLHCGTYSYEGDFVLRGIMVIFVLTCTPLLMLLGIIGVSRWSQMAFLPRVSTGMSLAAAGSSCAFCLVITSLIVTGG